MCTVGHPSKQLFDVNKKEMTDYSWRAPSETLSCWYKAHNFYIPNGLFVDKVRPIRDEELADSKCASTFQCSRISSNLYAKKRKALGMELIKRGRKKKKTAHTVNHAATDLPSDNPPSDNPPSENPELFVEYPDDFSLGARAWI